MNRFQFGLALLGAFAIWWPAFATSGVSADWADERYVDAPPNHVVLSNTLNGWYFVPKRLKEQYDGAMRELESLQQSIDAGTTGAAEARTKLAGLKERLGELRRQIEASRVLVEGATIHQQSETIEFQPGAEQVLVITANHVRVVGWDRPTIKAELKKTVLSPDGKPVDEHLQAIKIVHVYGRADFAGKTDAEWEAEEREYLAGDGANLSQKALAGRRELIDEIRRGAAVHREYVGKEVDQLSIAGLEYENNASITMGAQSQGGEAQIGSSRQRYGELTVYVPQQKRICVRGARRGLLVENVKSSVTIVDEASTDSDARGRFEVTGLIGNLLSKDFPLQKITNVDGHVLVDAMLEFGVEGAGTMHHDDMRDMSPGRAVALEVQQVSGGVALNLGRVRADLRNIRGQINVLNEFGDTKLTATGPLAAEAHRIFSQSGRIEVVLDQAAWSSVPVIAVTCHGDVRTNLPRDQFDDFHLTAAAKLTGWHHTWQGFRSVQPNEDPTAVFNLLDRFDAAVGNRERSEGLDLISRGGHLSVLVSQD